MAVNLVSAEQLSKTYGDKVLFEGINLGLSQGDKVALVARNGTGKSTLLSVLAGTEAPDAGQVVWRKGVRVGTLLQEPELDPEATVLDCILYADDPVQQAIRHYERLIHQAVPDQAALDQALAEMDAQQAWDFEPRVHQVQDVFGLTPQLETTSRRLSGGQRKRLALARLLLSEPDVLLLDEPTNHLDLDMIEWLEAWLLRTRATLLLITHDRWFLDAVCSRIWELEGGRLIPYEGNYAYYLEKKAEREAAENAQQDKMRAYLRKELEWLQRQPKARTTKSKARIDQYHEKSEAMPSRKAEPELLFQIKTTPIGGKVLDFKSVRVRLGDRLLIRKFTYAFKRQERVGIVGKNGVGKSTLLRLIMGEIDPEAGKVEVGESIVPGYYRQDGLVHRPGQKVLEVITDIAESLPLQNGSTLPAAQFLNRFGFPYGMHRTEVERLSGGERRRLHLLTVLIRNPNLLILDEPTNDLDLPTLNLLEEFLMHYQGCLVIVSHDRYFLDRLVDHLFVLEGDGEIHDFNGNYQQWQSQRLAQAEQKKMPEPTKVREQPAIADGGQPEKPKVRLSYKEQREYAQLEQQIALLEARVAELERQMSSGVLDHEALAALSADFVAQQKLLDSATDRWMQLAEYAD
ncbi:MAG: ABC-F family ATP-binding cassette domain-containing protein [Sphingobacteriia bacterium]